MFTPLPIRLLFHSHPPVFAILTYVKIPTRLIMERYFTKSFLTAADLLLQRFFFFFNKWARQMQLHGSNGNWHPQCQLINRSSIAGWNSRHRVWNVLAISCLVIISFALFYIQLWPPISINNCTFHHCFNFIYASLSASFYPIGVFNINVSLRTNIYTI